MLEAAVAVGGDLGQEQVLAQLRLLPEQLVLHMADAAQVGGQAHGVRLAAAGQDQAVRHAVDIEIDALERGHLHRVIDQFFVTGGAIGAEARFIDEHFGHRGRQLPAGTQRGVGPGNADFERCLLVALRAVEQRTAVKEATARVEPGLAHRVVVGVNLVLQAQRAAAGDAKAALVDALDRYGRAVDAGAQAQHVLGEIAHQVAAADPRRQAEHLVIARTRQLAADLVEVSQRVERDGVADRTHGGPWGSGNSPILPTAFWRCAR